MKRLDASTLEVLAETICGSGDGSGGGYDTPGPYRTKGQIYEFFRRSGVEPKGISSTRKWFVLESLQAIDGTGDMEKILLRLTSPKEYRGDSETTKSIIDHVNTILQVEGLEVALVGIDPQIRERRPEVIPPKPKEKPIDPPPDFRKLVQDSTLADILAFRWEEAQKCVRAKAYLSAIVMMGSILEGVLLHKVESDRKTTGQAKCSPKDKKGTTKPIQEWSLSSLINVAHEVNWLQGDVKRFSHSLRESRNIVHPYQQRVLNERPDEDTCSICWLVVRAAVADLLGMD